MPWKGINMGQLMTYFPDCLAPVKKTCKPLFICPERDCPVLG